jgi:regulator of sirC expression with transglutaminase-like and TPR domain
MKRLLPALVAFAVSLPVAAQTIDGPQEYRTCLILAKTKPEQGWEEALAWQSLGGGEAARHCGAVALIGLGKHAEAASRLETLANESVREDGVRAQMLAQAAQAWMLAGKLQRADAAQRSALILAPNDPDILLDHAVLLAQVHHYNEVITILTGLLRRQPHRVEALVLRASAFRYQDNLPGALDDVEQALKLDADFPDALLERGMIRRLKGDDAGAREDWRRAIEAWPDSDAAETARRNLEKLDVKVK